MVTFYENGESSEVFYLQKELLHFFLGLNVFLVRDLFNVLFLKIKHTFIVYFHQWNNLIVKIKILGTKNHLCG